MNVPNVIGYLENDAKKKLAEEGFITTSIYYDGYNLKHYNKSNHCRVVRQKKINNEIQILLVRQCILS